MCEQHDEILFEKSRRQGGSSDYAVGFDTERLKCYNIESIIIRERMAFYMDIQKIITEALEKLSENKDLRKAFDVDPVKTLEKIFKIDLPDDQINAVIKAIQAKLDIDDVADVAGKVLGGLGGLFGKK